MGFQPPPYGRIPFEQHLCYVGASLIGAWESQAVKLEAFLLANLNAIICLDNTNSNTQGSQKAQWREIVEPKSKN